MGEVVIGFALLCVLLGQPTVAVVYMLLVYVGFITSGDEGWTMLALVIFMVIGKLLRVAGLRLGGRSSG